MTVRSYVEILKLALRVVAVALVPVLIWYLFGVILMVFGAVIFAMLLRLGAEPIAVVIFTAVNLIYVRDTLGEKTELIRKLR